MQGLPDSNPWPRLLKQLRFQNSYTQTKAADLFGVDQTTWSRWERGKITPELDVQRMVRDLLNRCDVSLRHDFIERLPTLSAVIYRDNIFKSRCWSWKLAEPYRICPEEARDQNMESHFTGNTRELYAQVAEDPAWKDGSLAILECIVFRVNQRWSKVVSAPIGGTPYMTWNAAYIDDVTDTRHLEQSYKITTFDELCD